MVILGCFLPFYPTNNPENQNFEKKKKILEILSFTHALWFLRYGAQQTEFLSHFGPFYVLLPLPPPLTTRRIKILKKWKKSLHHHFTQVYHKWQSSAIWFLRYQLQERERESSIFLTFYPANSLKNENIKIWKKHLKISSFYTSVPKLMIISYTVLEIWHVTDVIVVFHFG